MNGYFFTQARETMHVNDRGEIARPAIGMPHSPQWIVRGAVRLNNFGHQVEFVPFPRCFTEKREWRFKNGKGRWFIADKDHGSDRVSMVAVTAAGVK
jgi:hypothetical protein